jgi:ribosomal peptide maturation radical SAM protein 1
MDGEAGGAESGVLSQTRVRAAGRRRGSQTRPERVLIILMPWATPDFPGLGPTLIRSVIVAQGLECDILYANLIFSRLNGGDPFVERQLSKFPICEVAFSPYYFGLDKDVAAAELRAYASGVASAQENHTHDRFRAVVDNAGACLDEVMASVDWDAYDIIGFSVMLQQTVASLALSKRIKALRPDMDILFGGPSVAYPMGEEMVRVFPEIDLVLEGEADGSIVPTLRWLRSGELVPPSIVPGIVYRGADGQVACTRRGGPFNGMDGLPIPDFGPFFEQLAANQLTHVEPYLAIETSRGCWWGQKHHCTFCGIDDLIMTYRSKSDERVLNEIVELSATHRTTEFFVVDSIINYKFFKEVLPTLADLREAGEMDFTFFFESKSNLKREQVTALRAAGVNAIQPGIESFSDHVLELMDKGTTGIRQIQCIKLLSEKDIVVNWNLIFRNPGETLEDYQQMLEMIPFMHHLGPTHGEGVIPMQINRFAPYHDRPDDYGVKAITPKDYMPVIFPDPNIDLNKLAFYFDYENEGVERQEMRDIYVELRKAVAQWTTLYRPGALVMRRGPGFLQIEDRRGRIGPDGAPDFSQDAVTTLREPWSDIFIHCDEVRSQRRLIDSFADRAEPAEIEAFLDRMVEARLIYRSPTGELLNLPLMRVGPR